MSQWILKNGLICDGSGSTPFVGDVCIEGDTIVSVGPASESAGAEVLDAQDLIVAPGLIDLHVHVYDGMNLHSVAPGDGGLQTGVTTMLDMGSAGAMNYGTFEKYVIPHAAETIFTLLNISQFGVQGHPEILPYIGDLHDPLHFNVEAALRCIEAHRETIVGVKVRLTASLADNCEANERAALKAVLELRDRSGLPLYVHHIASSIPLAELLDNLQAGDVLTHVYHGVGDGGFTGPNGSPGQALRDARERGVWFDVGHGSGAFAWRIAEPAYRDHAFEPDAISTDLHRFNIESPVVDMTTTMSKFLLLGMSLERVIQCTTSTPAKILQRDDQFGHLLPGRRADVTLLRWEEGPAPLIDSEGAERIASRRLVPVAVFKNGHYVRCTP